MLTQPPAHEHAARAQHHFPHTAIVTSYCLLGKMRYGGFTHRGAAASITHPRGTKLTFARRVVAGIRRVRIEDTGRLAWSQVDVWAPSCDLATGWGRRLVRYRVGW